MKCYQAVGYFQVQSRLSVAFLREEIQLPISEINYFDSFKRFLYNKNLEKAEVENFL